MLYDIILLKNDKIHEEPQTKFFIDSWYCITALLLQMFIVYVNGFLKFYQVALQKKLVLHS